MFQRESNLNIRINIDDPLDFYSKNEHLETLRKLYNGKNYNNKHIVNIESIILQSECIIRHDDPSGGYADFIVNAKVINFIKGDIIACCEVTLHNEVQILCKKGNIFIHIETHEGLKSIKHGQLIHIEVISSSYNLYKSDINVIGKLYLVDKIPVCYKVKIDEKIDEKINKELKTIKDELKLLKNKIKEIKTTRGPYFKFITNLYYPFSENKSTNTEKNLSLNDENINIEGYVERNPNNNFIDGLITIINKTDNLYIEAPAPIILLKLYREYYNYLNMLIETSNIDEKIMYDNYKNIIRIYTKHKK